MAKDVADNIMENMKEYAVVKFLLDNTYSEVPVAWLLNENNNPQCWWPPRAMTNISTLMTDNVEPNYKTWSRYEVDIIKYCSQFSCIVLPIFLVT